MASSIVKKTFMANTEEIETPRDVEIGNEESPEADPPAPPTVLKQARLGNLDLFRTVLESGNHPLDFKAERAVHFNRTPLHLAAIEGHEEIVEFILGHPEISRDVVNAKDCFGYTPLHLAVRHVRMNVVRLLTTSSLVLPDKFLAATSEPDDLGRYCGGYTPLHFTAVSGHTGIAELLLRQPCQVEFACDPVSIFAMTWSNLTPLDLARLSKFLYPEVFLEASDSNWLLRERERCATSVNAILVGAALVAAATFSTWGQPPGGIPAPHSAASGVPTPSPSTSSLLSSTDWNLNAGFYLCVSCAFSFSLVSLSLGTLATFPFPEVSLQKDLRLLRRALKWARNCLPVALWGLICAFTIAGVGAFDKFTTTDRTTYKLVKIIVNLFPTAASGTVAFFYQWYYDT